MSKTGETTQAAGTLSSIAFALGAGDTGGLQGKNIRGILMGLSSSWPWAP
jgi:hypothetical protein